MSRLKFDLSAKTSLKNMAITENGTQTKHKVEGSLANMTACKDRWHKQHQDPESTAARKAIMA